MKKEAKTTKTTTDDLAKMISILGKNLDLRISKLESYMKQGFESLDNKVDHIDARMANQIDNLARRMDDFSENKVSKLAYKELEKRISFVERKLEIKK